MKRIGIIGTGNMGSAIARSLKDDGSCSLFLYNRTKSRAVKLAEETRGVVLSSLDEMDNMDAIILAVKPQTLPSLYPALKKLNCGMFISLAAGVSLSTLEESLSSSSVVRYMPNIAAGVKSSVTAVTWKESLDEEKKNLALALASSFGSAFYLDESLFNGFIGISGSGIAYVFLFMHALSQAGVREGIPYNTSLDIVRDTLESAIMLQKATSKGATELENMVCSPRGTTIEGIKKLKELNFENAVFEAVNASSSKARSLEEKN